MRIDLEEFRRLLDKIATLEALVQANHEYSDTLIEKKNLQIAGLKEELRRTKAAGMYSPATYETNRRILDGI